MASSFINTLNTCCGCHSRFQAPSEPKMKKRASWNHADICTTLLLWNCLECQSAETDGNSGSNNIDKHIKAAGYWAKIGRWKCVCWEIPVENFLAMPAAHAQLHSACCQPGDILLWKDTLKSWHETMRILLDFQLVTSTVSSVELQRCAETVRGRDWTWWERGEKAAGGPHPQEEEEGAQGSSLSWGGAALEEVELVRDTVCP